MTGINNSGQTPSEILAELGIREPEDLDIEAIAQHCGATIQYKPLAGCEARIMGLDDAAIITINVTPLSIDSDFREGMNLDTGCGTGELQVSGAMSRCLCGNGRKTIRKSVQIGLRRISCFRPKCFGRCPKAFRLRLHPFNNWQAFSK